MRLSLLVTWAGKVPENPYFSSSDFRPHHTVNLSGSLLLRTERLQLCVLFIYLFIFWCGPFLKSLLNLLQYCFCSMFWFFGHEACGILAPQPGIKPASPALEGEVLTTGPPGKSLCVLFLSNIKHWPFSVSRSCPPVMAKEEHEG